MSQTKPKWMTHTVQTWHHIDFQVWNQNLSRLPRGFSFLKKLELENMCRVLETSWAKIVSQLSSFSFRLYDGQKSIISAQSQKRGNCNPAQLFIYFNKKILWKVRKMTHSVTVNVQIHRTDCRMCIFLRKKSKLPSILAQTEISGMCTHTRQKWCQFNV